MARIVVNTEQMLRVIRLLDQQLVNDPLYQGSNLWREVQAILKSDGHEVSLLTSLIVRRYGIWDVY